MSVFDRALNQRNEEQMNAALKMRILQVLQQWHLNQKRVFETLDQLIFENQRGLQPQAVVDILGDDAEEVLFLHKTLKEQANQIRPDTIAIDVVEDIQRDKDGRVDLGDFRKREDNSRVTR